MFGYFFQKIRFIFLILLACLLFLLGTEPGLYSIFYVAEKWVPGNLSCKKLHGYLLGNFSIEGFRYFNASVGLNVEAKHVDLVWKPSSLMHRQFSIQSFDVTQLKMTGIDVQQLHVEGLIDLTENWPVLLNTDLKIDSRTSGKIQIKGDAQDYAVQLIAVSYQHNIQEIDPLQLDLTGNLRNIFEPAPQFDVLASWKNLPIDKTNSSGKAQLSGDFNPTGLHQCQGKIEANLKTAEKKVYPLTAEITGNMKNIQAKITAGDEKVMLGQFILQGEHNPTLNLHWTLKIPSLLVFSPAAGQVNVQGEIRGNTKDSHFITKIESTELKMAGLYIRKIVSQWDIKHFWTKKMSVDWDIQLKPGDLIYYPDPNNLAEKTVVPFQKMDWRFYWKNNILRTKTAWVFDAAKRFEGESTIKPFNLEDFDPKHLKRQHLSGNLSLAINNLAFLNQSTSPVKNMQGTVQAKFKLAGTLGKPKWDGASHLKARAELPDLGLILSNVELNLKSNDKKMQLVGQIVSGKKALTIKGESVAPFSKEFKATLSGNHFLLMNTKEYQIYVTPDLNIEWVSDKLHINGSVDVPSARIQPLEFTQSLELPPDVVFVSNKEKKKESAFEMDSRIDVRLGDDVRLNTHGVKGRLTGTVIVMDKDNEPTTGEGAIEIVDGTYDAYGQKLNIETGRATFNGSTIDNPQLLVRAVRTFATTTQLSPITNSPIPSTANAMPTLQPLTQFNNIVVGVEVSGYMENPVIRLFSVPATLSQSDILSFLVLGRPMSQASSADGALLVRALSALNITGGESTQITQQLQRAFGLDVFNVETTSQYDPSQNMMTSSTSLVIGKMLSPRLFVDYSIGILDGTNIFKVKYFMTPKWILQTETNGSDEGVDILYSFTRD